ncbi:hypothetical protein D3C76_611100 [compost metagenome]
MQVADQFVGVEVRRIEILRQLHGLAVFTVVHLLDLGRVDTGGFEVRCTALQQGERLLETTLIRPLVRLQAQVPFADHEGAVAALFQQFGDRIGTLVQITLVPRLAPLKGLQGFRHGTEAGEVVVGAGHQHRARNRTGRRGVQVGELQAIPGQLIQGGRIDFAAVAAQVGITQVIGDDQQDIGLCRVGAGRHGQAAAQCQRGRQYCLRQTQKRHVFSLIV